MKYDITTLGKIPKGPHYVILIQDFYMSDSGYPESGSSRYDFLSYVAFDGEGEWRQEIERLSLDKSIYNKKEFKAFVVYPAEVKTEVSVSYEIPKK